MSVGGSEEEQLQPVTWNGISTSLAIKRQSLEYKKSKSSKVTFDHPVACRLKFEAPSHSPLSYKQPTEAIAVVKGVPVQNKNLILYRGHISKALDHNHRLWINLAEQYGVSCPLESTIALGEHVWIVELSKIEGIKGMKDETPYFRASYKSSPDQEHEDSIVFPSSKTAAELRDLQSKGILWIRLSTDYSNLFSSAKKSANRLPRSLHLAVVRLFEVWRSLTIEQVFKGLCCESPAKQSEILRLLESGEVRGVHLTGGRWEVDDQPSASNQKGIRFKPFTQGMKRLNLQPFSREAIAQIKKRACTIKLKEISSSPRA